MRRNEFSRGCISLTIKHVLHIGFRLKLFRGPCRNTSVPKMTVHAGRTIRLSHEITSRSVILLGGRGALLPLGLGGVGSLTIVKPGTGRMRFKSCA